MNEVILNPDPANPRVGVGQIVVLPFNVSVEAVQNSAFETYNLATAFPQTTGTLETADDVYSTNLGNLELSDITALSFRAEVPEPLTLSLFGAGLAGAAALRRRKKA